MINHLYYALRNYLTGDVLIPTDNNVAYYRRKGVEFLRAMIPIHRGIWPPEEILKNLGYFFNLFRR